MSVFHIDTDWFSLHGGFEGGLGLLERSLMDG
jgi:hypothetical protein